VVIQLWSRHRRVRPYAFYGNGPRPQMGMSFRMVSLPTAPPWVPIPPGYVVVARIRSTTRVQKIERHLGGVLVFETEYSAYEWTPLEATA
jgi:hypothetical protein